MPLRARARLRAGPRRDRRGRRARAKLMFLNYPNNPTGAVVPDGFFERVVEFARANDILVVHDNAYSEIVLRRLPRALVPRDARRQGRRRRGLLAVQGLQHDRLALRRVVGNAEAIATYWRLKTNIDSGLFEAVQLAGVAALSPDADAEVAAMNELYRRRRDLVCDALHADRRRRDARRAARSTCGRPSRRASTSSAAYCEHVLERGRRGDLPGRRSTAPPARAGSGSR